jgi:hypothetical protein
MLSMQDCSTGIVAILQSPEAGKSLSQGTKTIAAAINSHHLSAET